MTIGNKLIKDLEIALERFGTYSYYDKGADEVMDINGWMTKLDKLTIKELGTTLSYVLDNHKDSGNLVECIIGCSDHREENDFGELLDMDERFQY
tara:strand:+ start:11443 stop:11727 length:285 start_codon:yes stop_codon:yes gene_type:complete